MKITRIRAWKVLLRSHETYYMSDGKTCDTVASIVVGLDTDNGETGWGEVCPIPHYLAAYADGVVPAIKEMSTVLLGEDPVGPEALMHKLNIHLKGHDYAKSAIDTALWDLSAKAANMPLYRLLQTITGKKMLNDWLWSEKPLATAHWFMEIGIAAPANLMLHE